MSIRLGPFPLATNSRPLQTATNSRLFPPDDSSWPITSSEGGLAVALGLALAQPRGLQEAAGVG
eukprot:4847095-Pyramimonas_sp.AAC.1